MRLRKSGRLSKTRKVLVLTTLILAISAATALAANLSGDGTIVGTTGADNISTGNSNDTVWGLGGADNIAVGNGNDVVDGNGKCPKGVASGVYRNGLPSGQYCEHGHTSTSPDTISTGSGNDTVYGGGGTNTISVGNGNDVVIGGPISDTISTGNGSDKVYLDWNGGQSTGTTPVYKGSTVAVGTGSSDLGSSVVHAQNGVKDTISCPAKNNTTVYADRVDAIRYCAHVVYTTDTSATPAFRRASGQTGTHKRTTVRNRAHHRTIHKHARAR